jgi:hypothetical protein
VRSYIALIAIASSCIGCKGNSLVVVNVSASPPLSDVTAFVGTATAGGRTVPFTVHPKNGAPVALPPDQSFGIEIFPSITGAISVHLEATGSAGQTLAVGDGAGTILSSARSDITIALGAAPDDLSVGGDGMTADMSMPIVSIAPTNFDYGLISKNTNGQTKTFTVTNISTLDTAPLSPAALTGADSSGYAVVTDGCSGVALKAGATCDVSVQFTPKLAGLLQAIVGVGGAGANLRGTSKGAWTAEGAMQDLSGGLSASNNAVWGTSANDVYVAGAVSTSSNIVHRDSTGMWRPVGNPGGPPLFGLWGTSATNVFAVGGGGGGTGGVVFHSDGSAGGFTQYYFFSQVTINGVWGSSATELYTTWSGGTSPGTHYGVYRSTDGKAWTAQMGSGGVGVPPDNLFGIWGSGVSDIYAVGTTGIYHSTGNGAWTQQNSTANMLGVWGSGASDVYAVGKAGVILHSAGDGTWQVQTTTIGATLDFYAVWGSARDDVWVVGDNGLIIRSAGVGVWDTTNFGSTFNANLRSVWGSSSGDVYAVGVGAILHYH